MKKLINLTPTKAGTGTLWRLLRNHPEVDDSEESGAEQPLYLEDSFIINKAIVDGAPIMDIEKIYKRIYEVFDEVYLIIILRDPIPFITSRLYFFEKLDPYIGRSKQSNQIFGMSILKWWNEISLLLFQDFLRVYIGRIFRYIEDLELIIGKDKTMVVELERLYDEQSRIYKFVGIDDTIRNDIVIENKRSLKTLEDIELLSLVEDIVDINKNLIEENVTIEYNKIKARIK